MPPPLTLGLWQPSRPASPLTSDTQEKSTQSVRGCTEGKGSLGEGQGPGEEDCQRIPKVPLWACTQRYGEPWEGAGMTQGS